MIQRARIQLTPESKRLLKKVAKAGKLDMRPVLKVTGIGYRKEVKAIFEKKQPRQMGLRWQQLSEPYATLKEIEFPGRAILVRTGKLKRSMTKKGADDNITLIGRSAAVFGSAVPYGAFHDEGTLRMPQRNFSLPSDRREQIWRNQISRDITRQLERQGIDVKGEILV